MTSCRADGFCYDNWIIKRQALYKLHLTLMFLKENPEPKMSSGQFVEKEMRWSVWKVSSRNPLRGFPTPKSSPGRFRLPSCASWRKWVPLSAESGQRRRLWKPQTFEKVWSKLLSLCGFSEFSIQIDYPEPKMSSGFLYAYKLFSIGIDRQNSVW